MSIIKSFSVGNGDMFYIQHNSDNFSIIDCYLSDDNKERIVKDIKFAHQLKGITRFISTHPDEDHIHGLEYLDYNIDILNYYCVNNAVTKDIITPDFNHYRSLRDNTSKAYYISRGCTRNWMNKVTDERGSSGISVVWPILENAYFRRAMELAENGESANNISAMIQYTLEDGVRMLWMGDLESEFMENIKNAIVWPKVDIIFAPHHGRDTGKIPEKILRELNPQIIIIGEAPSEYLNYYDGYNTITQNGAGDITFECINRKVHIFVSNPEYMVDFLDYDEGVTGEDYYIGTLAV